MLSGNAAKMPRGFFKLVVSDDVDDRFWLTPQQYQQLRENGGVAVIICDREQITQYAHSCVGKSKLIRILEGENSI